jgi:major vault protein
MSRYNDEDNYMVNNASRQKDLVLATNEFVYVQSKTNGQIKVYTGPIMLTISAQESLVIFNEKTKRFEETQDFERARQTFVSAPEGWYVVLKNPAVDNMHPEVAKAVNGPELQIGHKINIAGPVSFSLFPGQMSRVIRGHRLRSNQYLIARVYDAAAANKNATEATMIDAEGKEITKATEKYFVGQLLVIKGTEVSFYIPPTGIEVISVDSSSKNYVRDAVTLERLEYAILKDEDGEKRYVHGPAVVFPKPTETFVQAPKGGTIFRALELSPISGIYIKVIAAYDEKVKDKTIHHPIGEELFITGKDQMIYYPRPEHAMIQYDGKYMHHAIAIPEGEGRYILNRLTGEIKTVKGPQMYLPDPRFEVVVKRKLSEKECELFYPGNSEVLHYNMGLTEQAIERAANKGLLSKDELDNAINTAYSTSNQESTLAIFEANANISRGVSYTKPRTITLDTKYDGVVTIDVWTGYAINVVSRSGKREVVVGPTTRMLNYDETLESMYLSTGKPKTTDNLYMTGFLRIDNNKVSDIINVQTKDFVDVSVKVSYCVNFNKDDKDKWFNVENYVKYLCDYMRSKVKREVKNYTIKDFYANSADILRKVILEKNNENFDGHYFNENGMLVYNVEILNIGVEKEVANILNVHQMEMIKKTIQLSDAEANLEVAKALAAAEKEEADLKYANDVYKQKLNQERDLQMSKWAAERKALISANENAEWKAKNDLQELLSAVDEAERARVKSAREEEIAYKTKLAEVEAAKQKAYADTVKQIVESISPDLVAALTTKANAQLLADATTSMAPYAIANNESVADTVNKLMRGTSLENIITDFSNKK